MDFVKSLGIAKGAIEAWASKPNNRKWWRRIDGTPIPNDLMVEVARAFSNDSGARSWPEGRIAPDDDGAASVAIATDHKHKRIIVRFEQPTEWIGLDEKSARSLIAALEHKLRDLPPCP